jgi:hypothetical protein
MTHSSFKGPNLVETYWYGKKYMPKLKISRNYFYSRLPGEITVLLKAWSEGEETALENLTPIVYRELHRLARRYM